MELVRTQAKQAYIEAHSVRNHTTLSVEDKIRQLELVES